MQFDPNHRMTAMDGLPIDLAKHWETTAGLREQISTLLLRHKVLLFRKQQLPLTTQVTIAKQWGDTGKHPLGSRANLTKDDGVPEGVLVIPNTRGTPHQARNDIWHSDVSCVEKPPAVNVLYAAQYDIPSGIGDTLFADMERAYATLASKELREALLEMDSYMSTHLYDGDDPLEPLTVSTATFHPTGV